MRSSPNPQSNANPMTKSPEELKADEIEELFSECVDFSTVDKKAFVKVFHRAILEAKADQTEKLCGELICCADCDTARFELMKLRQQLKQLE